MVCGPQRNETTQHNRKILDEINEDTFDCNKAVSQLNVYHFSQKKMRIMMIMIKIMKIMKNNGIYENKLIGQV